MAVTRTVTAKSSEAIDMAAKALTDCAPESRPLGIFDDESSRAEVMAHAALSGRIGVRTTTEGALWEASTLGAPAATSLLANLDENVSLRRSAARVKLLVRVYRHIKKVRIRNPLILSAMFRDVLSQINDGDPDAIDREAVLSQHSRDQAELQTLLNLWENLCSKEHEARDKTLEGLAHSLRGPVVYLYWGRQSPPIARFLAAVARSGNDATMIKANLDDKSQALDRLWSGASLGDDQEHCLPTPYLYHAESIEEAAQASLAIVGEWRDLLANGKGSIGLVGHDRLLVRRVHSLFLQAGLNITDRSGWLARNLLVGRALIAVASVPGSAKEMASLLQQVMAHGKEGGWWKLPRMLADPSRSLDIGLPNLEALVDEFSRSSEMPPADWFNKLADTTTLSPLKEFFEGDTAGESLRGLLRLLASEFSDQGSDADLGMHDIRGLLVGALWDTAIISDTASSNIQLVGPGLFSTQHFDALLLLGANESNLPQDPSPGFFSRDVLQSLGLPTPEDNLTWNRQATALRLAHHDHLAAVWSGAAGASPYLELMKPKMYYRLPRPWAGVDGIGDAISGHSASMHETPRNISPSGFATLLSCPYRYHSHKGLGLEQDRKRILNSRDEYGSFVHEILAHFHHAIMRNPELDYSKELQRLTELAAMGSLPELEGGLRNDSAKQSPETRQLNAWEWSHVLGTYVAEMRRLSETDFVGIEAVEKNIEATVMVGDQEVLIRGTCDRMDRHQVFGKTIISVVDFKTGNMNKYKDPLENPQLPIYIAMSGTKSGWEQSAYWGFQMSAGQVRPEIVRLNQQDPEMADSVLDDIASILKEACIDGTTMPANGAPSTCSHCPYKGLCRKEHWLRESRANQ